MNLFHHPRGPRITATFLTSGKEISSITLAEHNQDGCCWQLESGALSDLINQWMNGYCEKEAVLPSLPLNLGKMPPFTKKILAALPTVRFGQVITYQQLASLAGQPKAFRAAGGACGRNPYPLVLPCHRILAGGGLGGFAFGLGVKRELLSFENHLFSVN